MTSELLQQGGGPSRRRSSAKSPTVPPTPVQLSLPTPRWSLTTRIKERDIWGLGLSSDLPVDEDALFAPKPAASGGNAGVGRRMGAIRLTSDTDVRSSEASSSAHVHPLQGKTSPAFSANGQAGADNEVLGDVSRPALRRLTSDMERIAGEGLSRRGSATESRKGKEKAEVEVEVLIHQVSPNETVAGIALLYGVDLSTLRKVNKLWPSDPAHLRKHLYVPLEACRWDRAKGSGGINLIRGPGEGQVTLVERGAFLAAAGSGQGDSGSREEGDLIDVAGSDGPGAKDAYETKANGHADMAWRTPIPEPSPIQWTGWHGGASPAKAGSDPSNGAPSDSNRLSPAASLDDPWVNASSSTSSAAPTASNSSHEWPGFDGASLAPQEFAEPPAQDNSEHEFPPGSRILDVVRIPASQLRFFPSAKQNPGSSRTSFDSSASASRTSLQITRADLAISSIPSSDGPSISNDMHFPDPGSTGGGLPPKPRSKSTMVRLRPPTSGELPPTSLANRISNLFSVAPPPPGLGSGAPPSSFARNSQRSARHASMDATNLLSPSGGGRMSLDSARSAYSALSGRSGKTGGSGRSAGGMSRSGSLRALGLSGLDGISKQEGEVKRDEVEMQRRGSEDTLKPVDQEGGGVGRVGSLRRGKKLD